MTQYTTISRALELRSIIDNELSKPIPSIQQVKHALRLLGPLLQDMAGKLESIEIRLDRLEYYIPEKNHA